MVIGRLRRPVGQDIFFSDDLGLTVHGSEDSLLLGIRKGADKKPADKKPGQAVKIYPALTVCLPLFAILLLLAEALRNMVLTPYSERVN